MSGKGLQHVRKSLSQYQRLRACLEIKWDTNWERGFLVYVIFKGTTTKNSNTNNQTQKGTIFTYFASNPFCILNDDIVRASEQVDNHIFKHYQRTTQKPLIL